MNESFTWFRNKTNGLWTILKEVEVNETNRLYICLWKVSMYVYKKQFDNTWKMEMEEDWLSIQMATGEMWPVSLFEHKMYMCMYTSKQGLFSYS